MIQNIVIENHNNIKSCWSTTLMTQKHGDNPNKPQEWWSRTVIIQIIHGDCES